MKKSTKSRPELSLNLNSISRTTQSSVTWMSPWLLVSWNIDPKVLVQDFGSRTILSITDPFWVFNFGPKVCSSADLKFRNFRDQRIPENSSFGNQKLIQHIGNHNSFEIFLLDWIEHSKSFLTRNRESFWLTLKTFV